MKRKGRPKKIKNDRLVSFRISEEQYQKIVKAARYQSNLENSLIGFSEMARRGLEITYPVNNTLDMFGSLKAQAI